MSPDDKAGVKIGKDDRTFGVDVHEWEVVSEGGGTSDPYDRPMRLIVSDFAGQKVNYVTHPFFMSPRGVYLLIVRPFAAEPVSHILSRSAAGVTCATCSKPLDPSSTAHAYHIEGRGYVHPDCVDYSEMIGDWLRRIYFRVPGARVVPIVTRSASLSPELLEEQLSKLSAQIHTTLSLLRSDLEVALQNPRLKPAQKRRLEALKQNPL